MKNKLRRLRVFSRHSTHNGLREAHILLPVLTCLRLGSTTVGNLNYEVEINKPAAIRNSASKFLMKKCFMRAGVKTADWWIHEGGKFVRVTGLKDNDKLVTVEEPLPFPLVAKSHFGSRGEGNYLLKDQVALNEWMKGKNMNSYIFERFLSGYNREYRLHITAEGCFYTCRKMLKEDCPKEERWHRHEDNCVWYIEENENFDKPVNWNEIVKDCVAALNATGLDVCSFDVKVESAKSKKETLRKDPKWALLECNSASSFGEGTLEKYINQIPKIVKYKTGK